MTLYLAEDVPRHGGRIGNRLRLGEIGGVRDRGFDAVADRGVAGLIHDPDLFQVVLEYHQRVLAARDLDVARKPVLLLAVLGRVRGEPFNLALDERGAFARPRPAYRLFAGRVARQDVGAVHHHARESVPRGADRDVGHGHLQPDRHRDRVAVVL